MTNDEHEHRDGIASPDDSDGDSEMARSGNGSDGPDIFEAFEDVDSDDNPFEELSAGDDELFEDVSIDNLEAALTPDADVEPDPLDGDFTAVVPKRQYCQDCEYFDAPPIARCTHPDGEILTLVDMEHFEVLNCPVVERRRAQDLLDEEAVQLDVVPERDKVAERGE